MKYFTILVKNKNEKTVMSISLTDFNDVRRYCEISAKNIEEHDSIIVTQNDTASASMYGFICAIQLPDDDKLRVI